MANENVDKPLENKKVDIFEACGAGDLKIVSQLLEINPALNAAVTNSNGDTPMHIASAVGHLEIVIQLHRTNPTVLGAKNANGDMPIHLAARNGHWSVIAFMIEHDVNINVKNEMEETPIHLAVRGSHEELVERLAKQKADINSQDSRGWTPLHVACQRRFDSIAILLLNLGCRPDVQDSTGETALHIACREDLLPVVQMLCSCGCDVDKENQTRNTPLMLAARFSRTELVRCLLLAGADMNGCTDDGVKASDIALANGRMEVGELLTKLSSTITRDRRQMCVNQLLSTSRPLDCVRVMLLGASAVGKTAIIESLKCGYVRSLLRRGGSMLMSAVTLGGSSGTSSSAALNKIPVQERGKPGADKSPPPHAEYTRGIDVQQVTLSVTGDVCFYEFSGYEPYHATYHSFVGDPNAVYILVVSMTDTAAERRRQLDFWLNFLRCRLQPLDPVGFAGCKLWAPRVLVVATHDDVITAKQSTPFVWNADAVITELQKNYESDLIIEPHIFTVDANQPNCAEMSTLRQVLAVVKKFVCEYLPPEVGLLQPVLASLPEWCRVLSAFPVVTWPSFVEYLRSRINLLATEEHISEVVNQLVVVGEVIHIKRDDADIIVLDPDWLGSDVIGTLLAHNSVAHSRLDGRLKAEDLRRLFPKTQSHDLIRLFELIDLATPGYNDVEAVCVLPCLDRSAETKGRVSEAGGRAIVANGNAGSDTAALAGVGGGFRIQPERSGQLPAAFPRIVCALRRSFLVASDSNSNELDTNGTKSSINSAAAAAAAAGGGVSPAGGLYRVEHWSTGVRIVKDGCITATVRLHVQEGRNGEALTVACRGPTDRRRELFFLQENVCEVLYMSLESSCPGLYLERAPLSAQQVLAGSLTPHAYRPRDVLLAQLAGTYQVQADNVGEPESLKDLVAFGDTKIFEKMRPGLDRPVAELALHARYRLAALLDPKHPLGHDWCMLAVNLGLADQIPAVSEREVTPLSRTDALLGVWARQPSTADATKTVTVRELHGRLIKLERPDVVEALLALTPLFYYDSQAN